MPRQQGSFFFEEIFQCPLAKSFSILFRHPLSNPQHFLMLLPHFWTPPPPTINNDRSLRLRLRRPLILCPSTGHSGNLGPISVPKNWYFINASITKIGNFPIKPQYFYPKSGASSYRVDRIPVEVFLALTSVKDVVYGDYCTGSPVQNID